MIIWCMLTQIWNATDIIYWYFRPFFALLPHYWPWKLKFGINVKNKWYYPFTYVYHKSRSYDIWFLRYKVQRCIWYIVLEIASTTEFFVILDYFLHFYPSNKPENQDFEKMKKTPGDMIILHMITINENHMIYDSWDIEHYRQDFFSFWTIFWPFTP